MILLLESGLLTEVQLSVKSSEVVEQQIKQSDRIIQGVPLAIFSVRDLGSKRIILPLGLAAE
jgi:hypothetical protein